MDQQVCFGKWSAREMLGINYAGENKSNFLVTFTSGAATSGNKKKFNMFTGTIINTGNQILFAPYLLPLISFSFAKLLILAVCRMRVTYETCIGRLS